MRIFVVDDEHVSRVKTELIMKSFGECDVFKDAVGALDGYRDSLKASCAPELIMLDISMPGMNGIELLSAIRGVEDEFRLPEESRATVIMVTSKSDSDTVVSCIKRGCDDYVVKPLNWKLIFNKLFKLKLIKINN